jgi:predicted flap endonuclease-1-like 5' DNA nuclease
MEIKDMDNHGFSLPEIKEAGIAISTLKYNNIPIDSRRKTCKADYIEILKKIELKQKPKVEGKPKKEKAPKVKKEKASKTEPAKGGAYKISKLDQLEGIDAKIIQKLADLGIDTPEKFVAEESKELAKLTKLTQKQLNAWKSQITG